MRIVGIYSFNRGKEAIDQKYPELLGEVEEIIKRVSAPDAKTKKSKEKTMPGKIELLPNKDVSTREKFSLSTSLSKLATSLMLYNPRTLNSVFKIEFMKLGWCNWRVGCEYSTRYYVPPYHPPRMNRGAFREMDFIKKKLGVEVQFGKYAFMVYNVCAKMTIFNRLGHIDAGIEIVPVKEFAEQMSTGVSYFEQFVWDLEHRGVADIDIPVLILGIDK